jgi:hypothetical protein
MKSIKLNGSGARVRGPFPSLNHQLRFQTVASATPGNPPHPLIPPSSASEDQSAMRSPHLGHPSCGGLGKPLGEEIEEADRPLYSAPVP